MSDMFASAYEKWLKCGPNGRNTDGNEEDDSNDGSGSEYAAGLTQSESEKSQKHLSDKLGNKQTPASVNDQAPILVDDDDEDQLLNKKQQYEDEPPILEPVPRQLQNCNISNVKSPQVCPQTCLRNYSRNNHSHSRTTFLQEQRSMKTYSSKEKVNHPESVIYNQSSHANSWKSKGSKSGGNIFDKFICENCDDFPPPLIPSPEAMQLHSDSPCSVAGHSSHSPDYCAMEADSTSEITGDKVDCVLQYGRLSKNSVHGEVLVECDSTCMLAASPLIVSPASLTNSDQEGTRDYAEVGNKDGELEGCDYKSDAQEEKTEPLNQSAIIQHTMQENLAGENIQEENYLNKDSTLQICPQSQGNSPLSSSLCKPLSINLNMDSQNEPPVLSAVSPPERSHYLLRRSRHTIDSPEIMSGSRKRSHIVAFPWNSESTVSDMSSPPTLIHMSETLVASCPRSKRTKIMLQQAREEHQSCLQDQRPCKRRHRRNTIPITDLTEYYGSLPEDLQSFVVGTLVLSQLQTHMHKLLFLLFPQLKVELEAVSPESFKFDSLLSDLVKLLEQPDEQSKSTLPHLKLDGNIKPAFKSRSTPFAAGVDFTSQSVICKQSSSLLSASDSQAAVNCAKCHLQSDASHSNKSLPLLLSFSDIHSCQQNHHHNLRTRQSNYEDSAKDIMVPLSQLTVKDMEEFLPSSQVMLFKDPEPLLERFVQLSCKALQLLLPDLTVSLYDELAQSPQDLIVFINNVILTNSRKQSRQ